MDLLHQAQTIQREIAANVDFKDLLSLKQKYVELEKLVALAKHVETQIRLIKLSSQTLIGSRIKSFRRQIDILLDKTPQIDDIKYLQKDDGVQEIAPGICLPSIPVVSEEYIPDTPLYYIKSTGEYGIKVLGCPITGTIGDISNNTKKHIQCPKSKCEKKSCEWHHEGEPLDWAPGNWMYCTKPTNRANQYMRHFGSRTTLRQDLSAASNRQKFIFGKQLAHDLLVRLCIDR